MDMKKLFTTVHIFINVKKTNTTLIRWSYSSRGSTFLTIPKYSITHMTLSESVHIFSAKDITHTPVLYTPHTQFVFKIYIQTNMITKNCRSIDSNVACRQAREVGICIRWKDYIVSHICHSCFHNRKKVQM